MLSYRLRHVVTLQKPVESQDPTTGAVTIAWETATDDSGTQLVDVPAEVLTGPGREFRESGTTQSETTARINLRWFPVDRLELYQWRILWDGRVYNIGSAETDRTARREWRLKCTDGLNDGE
ncbi:head-tail adaptor protein [Aestuariicella hydrocarbonica]|uniref:Head-tail adaptor protein n=1 Tax=Pseudomaricurvus hydrocarbonicus TaxID=1470433 RepID=A0A9E5JYP5_9GAMM|nr:head-tail adaptor protein [Aestuariicella hydrocarbonica]NHO64622.1 head-tail adaptor protein [Aestuariicella hydrocarbonica]